MPNLSDHKSSFITKLLLEGDSGTGKTTALACLVEYFKLRILDFDNGLDPLIGACRRMYGKRADEFLANVEFETLRDKYTSSPLGPVLSGMPTAFVQALKFLDKWSDESKPQNWGPGYILIIDSLTHLSNAAYNWAKGLHGALGYVEGKSQKGVEPRTLIYTAQGAVETTMAQLTSESFNTNLIVISHIRYTEQANGTTKGYPLSVGAALGPKLLTYFNNHVLQFDRQGADSTEKRFIRTKSTNFLDLKTARNVKTELDSTTGLLEFFNHV